MNSENMNFVEKYTQSASNPQGSDLPDQFHPYSAKMGQLY